MDDMSILWPEQEVTVGNSTVTVNEMTFGQSARLGEYWRPVADAVLSELPQVTEEDASAYGSAVYAIAERYASNLIELILATAKNASGEPLERDWVEGLSPDEGMLLAVVWLTVHLRFFGATRAGKRGQALKKGKDA